MPWELYWVLYCFPDTLAYSTFYWDRSRISERGGANRPGGGGAGTNIGICQILRKTAWHWEKFGPLGAAGVPPKSAIVLVLGDEEAREEGVPGVVPESRDVRFSNYFHDVTAFQMKHDFACTGLVSTSPWVCRALLYVVLLQTGSDSVISVRKDVLKGKEKVRARLESKRNSTTITDPCFRMHN